MYNVILSFSVILHLKKKHIRRNMTFISLLVCSTMLSAMTLANDSSKTVNLDEVVVKTTSKQTSQLRNTATSVSLIDKETINNRRITELGDLNALVPNFFMPEYGSKLSSALYIRGIGSRINTPAVALYVDDAPVAEKSEYTLNLFSIDHIDVLRGPQSTLYGRNAMGGILRLYTRNPLYHQGTDINVSGATRNELFKVSATTNQKISDKVAFSLGGFYETNKGFFHNDSLDRKVGSNDAFGFNAKLVLHPSEKWRSTLRYGDSQCHRPHHIQPSEFISQKSLQHKFQGRMGG